MKLGLFTDSHYSSKEITCSVRYNSKSLEKIEKAYRFFENKGCELVICLGDLIDKEDTHKKEIENLEKVARIINSSPIPTVCVMGNHDGFAFTQKEFYEILGGCEPLDIVKDGKTLIFIDACYFKNGDHYAPGDSDWENTFYPFEKEFKEKLDNAKGEVFVFVHQNLDPIAPCNHRIFNADVLCRYVEQSGKVKRVFQGHYHQGSIHHNNNVEYVTFPAMCQNENAVFTVVI